MNRSANGAVTCTLTRTNFTGSVSFSVSGLPTGVTAAFNPASTTGNSTAVTFTAGANATLGLANVTISAAAMGLTTRTAPVALTIAGGPTGGVVTAVGAVASNSPWFAEEQVRLSNTATLTALTVTYCRRANPASLASSGQYNTIGGSAITQSVSTTATQVTYSWTLAAGQTLPAGTGRTFAAQMSPGGNAASHHRRQLVGDLHQRGHEHDDQRDVLTISSRLATGGSIRLPPVHGVVDLAAGGVYSLPEVPFEEVKQQREAESRVWMETPRGGHLDATFCFDQNWFQCAEC